MALSCNRTIKKSFSFRGKHIIDVATVFCSAIWFVNALNFDSKFLMAECYIFSTNSLLVDYFIAEIRKHYTDFSTNGHYYCFLLLIFFKGALMEI